LLTVSSYAQSNPAREAAQKRGTQTPADGVWYVYDKNGNLQKEEHYRTYRLDGDVKTFYPSGAIKAHTPYVDGQRHGFEKTYYEKGGLQSENTYVKNNLEGASRQYYDNGALKREANYRDGQLDEIVKDYYQDGTLKQIWNYTKGVVNGAQLKYAENGQVQEESNYVNGVLVASKDYTKESASLVSVSKVKTEQVSDQAAADPIPPTKEEKTAPSKDVAPPSDGK
jgi:antitoxin component YwqK of YwqJK toxin-antitoxin module